MNRPLLLLAALALVGVLIPTAYAQDRPADTARLGDERIPLVTHPGGTAAAVPPGYEHLLAGRLQHYQRYTADSQTGRLTLTPEGRAWADRLADRRPAALPPTTRPRSAPARPATSAEPVYNSSALVFTVDNAYDDPDLTPGDGLCRTTFNDCTLRAALREALAQPASQIITIQFGMTYGPFGAEIAPGVWRVQLALDGNGDTFADPLPFADHTNLTINGLTQPGASCGDLVNGTLHNLKVILDGSFTNAGSGFDSVTSGFTARGLVIQNFDFGYGIVASGTGSLAECNYVGTDYTGELVAGNLDGMYVNGTVRNNLASGNSGFGIEVPPVPFMTVARNFVGTDDDGNQPLGNNFTGILVRGDDATVTTNLVSANASTGIELFSDIFGDPAVRAKLTNNTVGLTRLRNAALGNGLFGIHVNFGASNNDIGLPGAGNGNFVGANFASGIVVSGTGTNDNRVRNNTVGLTASGAAAPNFQGIFVGNNGDGSPFDTVIGSTASGNVSSGNNAYGIVLNGDSGSDVEGNTVGLTAGGTARPNSFGGVIFTGTTGGSTVNGNTVSGNNGSGVTVFGGSVIGAVIRENHIGTNTAGTATRPNALSGVVLDGAFGATVRNNTISGNTDTGLFLANGTSGDIVEDNFIGTNASGASLGNGLPGGSGRAGVFCQSATGVRIGKNFSPNTVAFNGTDGIFIGEACQDISIVGNVIYSNGGLAVDLAPDGVNPNDVGDGDTGANEKLNFPVVTSAQNNGTNSIIAWTLNARPNTTYELLFCRLPAPDPSGFGECEGPNALHTTTTNGAGNASGTQNLGAGAYPAGTWVTANATKVAGALPQGYRATSEFGQARQVQDTSTPPGIFLTATNTSPLTVAPGGSISFSYSIQNNTPAAVTGSLFYTVAPGGLSSVVLSGTLPAGQTISSSFVQHVPGSAPPGSYTYTLRIGQFPNVTVDQEAFAVTVTGTREGGASTEALGLDAWPVSEVAPWQPVEASEPAASRGDEALPAEVTLAAAYPNPFAEGTTLAFTVPTPQRVTLTVYDVLGREVMVLVNEEREAGRHATTLDGASLPSGTYLVRLTTNEHTLTQRVTLLR